MAKSATELRPQLDGLQASIDALAESDLRAELIEIRRAIDRLESVFARGFRRFEGANKYARRPGACRSRLRRSGGSPAMPP